MDERELIRQMKSGDRCHLLALHWTAAQRGELSLLDLSDHDSDCKEKGKRAQQTTSGRGHSEQN